MSISTPARHRTPHTRGMPSIDRGTGPRDHVTRSSSSPRGVRAASPVTPVEFVEPENSDPAPKLRHPHADRSGDTMRRLRTPFTLEAA